MVIRRARADEAGVLTEIALQSKAYWGYETWFLEACRAELTVTPEFLAQNPTFVIEREGQAAGFYSLQAVATETVDLYYLFIKPDAIGSGLGKQLWAHAAETARALGYRVLVTEADPNAEPFYAKMGMVRYEEKESALQAGRMLPLMRLAL